MLLPRRVLVVVIGLGLAACGGPDAGSPGDAAPASRSAAPSLPPSGSASPPVASAAPTLPPSAPDPPGLALEPVASGLAEPIGIATAPGGWLLVQERGGRLLAVDSASGEVRLAVDLGDRVLGEGERGLLGTALHPAWPDDPRLIVHYSDANGDTVISELTGGPVDGAPVLDPGSERVLLRVEQPFANHNGGQLAFGPDGYLWIGLGDGGSGGDPEGNGQDPTTLLGAILRLDLDARGDEPYAIPIDNAFSDGTRGAPEVHVWGLRNPWRFSFDPASGALWIADVGQNAFEEVNRLGPGEIAGANLGWNVMEASHCFADPACDTAGLVLPLAEYGRESGCAVTGGHVYRGSAVPGLAGWYVFGDYCAGTLFGVRSDHDSRGGMATPTVLGETGAAITSFGVDAGGELYLVDIAGSTLYRIVARD